MGQDQDYLITSCRINYGKLYQPAFDGPLQNFSKGCGLTQNQTIPPDYRKWYAACLNLIGGSDVDGKCLTWRRRDANSWETGQTAGDGLDDFGTWYYALGLEATSGSSRVNRTYIDDTFFRIGQGVHARNIEAAVEISSPEPGQPGLQLLPAGGPAADVRVRAEPHRRRRLPVRPRPVAERGNA